MADSISPIFVSVGHGPASDRVMFVRVRSTALSIVLELAMIHLGRRRGRAMHYEIGYTTK